MSTAAHEHTDRSSAQGARARIRRRARLTALATAALVAVGIVPGPAVTTAAATEHTEVVPVPKLPGGRLQAWGDPQRRTAGELDVPPLPEGLDYVDAAAGHGFGLALRSDGQAVSFGAYRGSPVTVPALPDGVRYAAVGAGEHGIAYFLTTAGDVVVVGARPDGAGEDAVPSLPSGVWYTEVAAAYRKFAALRSDGTIAAWGDDSTEVPALPDGLRYVDLVAGEYHFLALRSDGRVVSWATRSCGEGDLPVSASSPYVALSAGMDTSFALRSDGSLVRRGCGASVVQDGPVLDPGERAVAVTATYRHGFVVTDQGRLVSWGAPLYGYSVPERPAGESPVVDVAAQAWGLGAAESLVLTLTAPESATVPDAPVRDELHPGAAGVVVWGARPEDELPPPLPTGVRYTGVSVGPEQVVLVRSDGGAVGYGDDAAGGSSIRVPTGSRVVDVSAGTTHAAFITARPGGPPETYLSFSGRGSDHVMDDDVAVEAGDGVSLLLSSEGATDKGAVSVHGPSTSSWLPLPEQPVQVPTVDVSLGTRHALLARADGTVAGWGDPAEGATAGQQPPAGLKFVQVAAGEGFSLGLLSDGTLRGWGRDTFGQASPPAPPRGERFVAVDAGRDHAVALVSDGSVVAWGRDDAGQASVEGVPAGTRFSAVSAGGDTTAAIVGEQAAVELSAPSHWPADDALPLAATVRADGGPAEGDVAFVVDGRTVAVVPLRDGTAVVRAWPGATEAPERSVQAVYLGAPGVAPFSATAAVGVGARSAPQPSATSATPTVDRLQGKDRYATAVAATSELGPDIPVLYLASGEAFADALSAAPAAAYEGGALLLTRRDAIPSVVEQEIRRLAPRRIVVVGGPGAVSYAVESRAGTLAPVVWRYAGQDRYQTSRRVVEHAFGTQVGGVVLADGRSFPDALAAGAASGASGVPVLLVPGNATTLDPRVVQMFQTLGVRGVTVVGGSGAVSPALEHAAGRVPGVVGTERLGGADRYATAMAVNDVVFGTWHDQGIWSPAAANLAAGSDFPDALAGAAAAGLRREPLFVVPSRCLPPAVRTALRATEVAHVRLYGGTGSLSPAVERLEQC
ncbi:MULTISPECIES: cell wall-binding repeat-containing protein [Cellulosimicrobium]|uniref:Cell wall-binding repeat-containing protein n=1 Tax=Cellulosimicrobium sp. ES-005 TaxID=3163031 RepID=A0AAU8G1P9_9MICO|nr:cell wall-binding repeat-containing protein [Cellulosimicrobium cellulans]MCO7273942.1 cell wall-binding repeat-containing protein [Cellulosimicrobium cellulans]